MTPKQRRLGRMRAIEREWLVASIAAEDLGERLRADPSALAGERLKIADYRSFRDDLELTYFIRLFAEFEAGLREAWAIAFRQSTTPRMQDLIDSIAARCHISPSWRDDAHNIRAYRNALIHEGGEEAQPIGLREACSGLCRFFSGLPHQW
jgi:hypothetical protein